MRKFIFLLSFLINNVAYAQLETIENLKFNDNIFDIVIIKVSDQSLGKFSFLNNSELQSHSALMNQLDDADSYFAINAGPVHKDCSPVGLFIEDFQTINPINLEDGEGNFFLKPNGNLIISDKEVVIKPSESFVISNNIRHAIQSGPMLLIDGNIHPSFNPNSLNLNFRNGVGVFNDKNGNRFLIFANSKDPISFYNFSKLFSEKYKCSEALCLESSGNVMKVPYAVEEQNDHTVCRYLIYKD